MEYINRIELCGNVGTVRIQKHNSRTVANLSVATTRVYRNSAGDPVMETTWHNVNVWEGRETPELSTIEKGMKVHVRGRMTNRRFTGADGVERSLYEVSASSLSIIDDPAQLSYEP